MAHGRLAPSQAGRRSSHPGEVLLWIGRQAKLAVEAANGVREEVIYRIPEPIGGGGGRRTAAYQAHTYPLLNELASGEFRSPPNRRIARRAWRAGAIRWHTTVRSRQWSWRGITSRPCASNSRCVQ
eukprot:1173469-Prorocentrum_minimum.AAC.1